MRIKDKNKKSSFKIIIICALIFTAMIGGGLWWFLSKQKPMIPVAAKPEKKERVAASKTTEEKRIPAPVKPQPVIDYKTVEKDPESKELMEKRKEEYGIDKGVDMIVRADESMKIGDKTISMQEILNKIELKKGGVVEQDIADKRSIEEIGKDNVTLFDKLKDSEKRFSELEALLSQPESVKDTDIYQKYTREYADIGKIIAGYKTYREITEEINAYEELLKNDDTIIRERLRDEIRNLRVQKKELEDEFEKRFLSEGEAKTNLSERLEASEKRFSELEKYLTDSDIIQDQERYRKYREEYAELSKIVADYKKYKEIVQKIEEKDNFLKNGDGNIKEKIRERINTLRLYQNTLENKSEFRIMPDKEIELYGIYVVQQGDNIWNIHFKFLKECFAQRGISLKSSADEPNHRGKSSGIGKILKFSENMVYIYNLREHRLDTNLNLIHPLSKIVVFNLKQAFSLLEQIDYENIHQIRYDGDTLWIPSEQ